MLSFKGAIRWGLRPKRIGILLAKLLLACTTELAAQTISYSAECGEPFAAPVLVQDQTPIVRTTQPPAPCAFGETAVLVR